MSETKIRYKLTNQNMRTRGGYQWIVGRWKEATGDMKQNLCSDAWLHCYSDPLLALFMNPIHAAIPSPRLFKVEVHGRSKDDGGLKCGFRRMRILEEMVYTMPTTAQKIAFGILCAKEICHDKGWNKWADNWLNGSDRTTCTADAAAAAAYADAAADAYATYVAAATAATAYAADAADAAATAATAATAAAYSAYAATAATAAADADAVYAAKAVEIDLIKIAHKAMKY